jgi:hypothetical protein
MLADRFHVNPVQLFPILAQALDQFASLESNLTVSAVSTSVLPGMAKLATWQGPSPPQVSITSPGSPEPLVDDEAARVILLLLGTETAQFSYHDRDRSVSSNGHLPHFE